MSVNDVYFASANSKDGFISFFDQVFGECSYRYILKGGSGTGKSSLMKKLGSAAEELGYQTEYILCSSDPNSVDGIIITDLGVCMIDGTAPHLCDVDLPGINSELVNLGNYWNKQKLSQNADKIKEKCAEKSTLYAKAYNCLNAMDRVENITKGCSYPAFNHEKAESYAARLTKQFVPYAFGKEKIRLIDSVGMRGFKTLSSFQAGTNYKIKPLYLTEYLLINAIYQSLHKKHLEMRISYRFLDTATIDGIYLPEQDVSFTIGHAKEASDKVINTERFVDKTLLAKAKNKLRFARRCKDELSSMATDFFAQIAEAHFSIEENYIQAMNFTKLTQDTNRLIKKILQENR
ncbi:MAG: hypothetical protein HFE77_01880 [Clostridiales bacterium]|nr:hypothetical protein [Clostridiales bacterium]